MAPTIAYIALAALGTMSPVVQANNDIKMLFIAKAMDRLRMPTAMKSKTPHVNACLCNANHDCLEETIMRTSISICITSPYPVVSVDYLTLKQESYAMGTEASNIVLENGSALQNSVSITLEHRNAIVEITEIPDQDETMHFGNIQGRISVDMSDEIATYRSNKKTRDNRL